MHGNNLKTSYCSFSKLLPLAFVFMEETAPKRNSKECSVVVWRNMKTETASLNSVFRTTKSTQLLHHQLTLL